MVAFIFAAAEQKEGWNKEEYSEYSDTSCRRLIRIQQKCKGCSPLPVYSSELQLHLTSHYWPQGATCTWAPIRARLNGIACVGSSVSSPLIRKWCLPGWVPDRESARETGIERHFMLVTLGWCSEMNEFNWRPDKRDYYLLDLMLLMVSHTLATDKDIIQHILILCV